MQSSSKYIYQGVVGGRKDAKLVDRCQSEALVCASPNGLAIQMLKSRCSVLLEEASGKFECLWDARDVVRGTFHSYFGHKIDLLDVKERSKQQNKEL